MCKAEIYLKKLGLLSMPNVPTSGFRGHIWMWTVNA